MRLLLNVVLAVSLVPSAIFAQANAPGQQAPAVPPPAVPSSGPSMTETIQFINDAFARDGQIYYEAKRVHTDSYQKKASYLGDHDWDCCATTIMTIHKQSVLLEDAVTLVYLEVATEETKTSTMMKDGQPLTNYSYDKKKQLPKGATQVDTDVKKEFNAPLKLQLDTLDPLSIAVQGIKEYGTSTYAEDGKITTTVGAPGEYDAQPFSYEVRWGVRRLGVFYSKDTAERVAKAYIHAIALCYKPKPKSLF